MILSKTGFHFSDHALAISQSAPEKQADRAHRHRQRDENHAERERQAEVALLVSSAIASHGAGITPDIAADDDDGRLAMARRRPPES